MQRHYLDYNATTPLAPAVRAAMDAHENTLLGNPSSLHAEGRRARAMIDDARDRVAAWLGARPSEIIFTSGGTESNNLAVKGLARAHAHRGRHLVTSAGEHHAVLEAFESLEKHEGFSVTYLPLSADGRTDPEQLRAALTPKTTLVSIMSANNETGVRQSVEALGAICKAAGVLFHCDAVQSAGKEKLELGKWNTAALSVTAHKFHGPPGVGVLYLRSGVALQRLLDGGTQENERRPGTENAIAIAGFAEAAARSDAHLGAEAARQFEWIEALWKNLQRCPGIRRNGDASERLANTLNFSVEGLQGESLLIGLDLAGLAVSSGSACLVGSVKRSHVLRTMGLSDRQTEATVRVSIGPETVAPPEEIATTILSVIEQQRAAKSGR